MAGRALQLIAMSTTVGSSVAHIDASVRFAGCLIYLLELCIMSISFWITGSLAHLGIELGFYEAN